MLHIIYDVYKGSIKPDGLDILNLSFFVWMYTHITK